MRGEWGHVRGSQPAFLRAFWANDERFDKGEGGQRINPLPPGCNHHRSAHHARSNNVFSSRAQAPASIFTHVLGERRAIRRGGGGTQAHINPLPPGCNHHRNAHHTRFNNTQPIFLRVHCWPWASSHAPPPCAPAVSRPLFKAA